MRFVPVLLLAAALAMPGNAQEGAPGGSKGKDPLVAYSLALAGTALPILFGAQAVQSAPQGDPSAFGAYLILGGLTIGPSTGQFYAYSVGPGIVASLIRSAGIGMGVVGLLSAFPIAQCDGIEDDGENCGDDGRGDHAYFIALGALTYLGGLAYSLVDTHDATVRFQARQEKRRLGLAPTLGPDGRGGLRPGALAYLRF